MTRHGDHSNPRRNAEPGVKYRSAHSRGQQGAVHAPAYGGKPGSCLGEQLPGILGKIEEGFGRDAALRIASAAGGRRTSFASKDRLTATNWLVRAVGLDLAIQITRALDITNGLQLEVPMGPASAHVSAVIERRRSALSMFRQGLSNSKIASALQITERRVRSIKKSLLKSGELP